MALNIAHRGASAYALENTMTAFEKAVQMGADGIKTEVQVSSDGVLVLINDEQLRENVEGSKLVKQCGFLELRKLGVPSLEELLILSKKNDLILNLELKNDLVQYENLEEKVIETLYRFDMMSNAILTSFNHHSVIKCKQIDNNACTGIIYEQPLYRVERYCRYVGADGINTSDRYLTREIVTQANKAELTVSAYTGGDEIEMKRLMKMGVDMIITKYPDKLSQIIREKQRKTS